ncbi:MAG TPA: hypoxanthine phosphoribosyltransferase [Synergistaceae bacterium]|nr:hypoxanthine phosphoribosyltransferase [Synergistaceae bacterium]HPJ25083.1 hypoxanthine phosphoribosyltransferase [Synergistaceae bacterium]HPQ37267.1 hypoxanthine phosphoribosyltransferase [Synergistaceae bacterium]
MAYTVGKVLISKEEIVRRIASLGEQISQDYAGQELVVVGVLKGAVLFLSDLVRQVNREVFLHFDFISVSSYGSSTVSSGIVKINKDLDLDIKGKHVLIVEDIIDTGLTLSYIIKLFEERKPLSVKTCVLLDKPERRKVPVSVDYRGFEIPDEFVVGYGLDYAERWRNLEEVFVLHTS